MLSVNESYLDPRLKRLMDGIDQLNPETGKRPDDARDRLQDLLEVLFEVVEHLCSRHEDSFSPTYHSRVRALSDMQLFEEDYVERVLVPLAWLQENRVGLHIPIREPELEETLTEQIPNLTHFVEGVQQFADDPASYLQNMEPS